MHSNQKTEYSRLKLAQLWHIRKGTDQDNIYSHEQIVRDIIEDEFNVNCKVTVHEPYSFWWKYKVFLNDCSVLHFLYCEKFNIKLFDILLNRGADFTIKNGDGQTVVHLIVTQFSDDIQRVHQHRLSFVNLILSAHVKHQNVVNPQDNNGISHLHGACITNHIESLNLFLDNGTSTNQAVKSESPYFPGYTPLHFAAEFASFESAQLLVSRGANVNVKNAEGKTPLDLFIKYRFDEMISLSNSSVDDDIKRKSRQKYIHQNEQILKLFMAKDSLYTENLSGFQLACTFEDLTIAEKFISQDVDVNNYAVPMVSSICPGYTAAHFAALNSIDALKMLQTHHGVKFEIRDTDDLMFLNICLKKYSIQDICDTLSCVQTNCQTKLLDLLSAMKDVNLLKLYLNDNIEDLGIVSSDSSLWPGFTILHLAVILTGKHHDGTLLIKCLKKYLSDINTKNSRGQTPLHLAFQLRNDGIVELFLEYLNTLDEVVNHVDEDNLSYLHIACLLEDTNIIEKLLRNSDPNVVYKGKSICIEHYNHVFPFVIGSGFTPLHIAVIRRQDSIGQMLLRHGANLHSPDANGLTPIHWLLWFCDDIRGPKITNTLKNALSANLKDCVVEGIGLSYLHVACLAAHVEAVEKLLDLGSNVNALVDYNCERRFAANDSLQLLCFYYRLTPLSAARSESDLIELLLRRGANVIDYCATINIFERHHDHVDERFMSLLWTDDNMQKSMEVRIGLTKLHIACYLKNEEAIRKLLVDGIIDVDVQVHRDSTIFAGCTPLHMLATFYRFNHFYDVLREESMITMIRLLLDHGANVTIANNDKDTPIHTMHKYREYSISGEQCTQFLLNAHIEFNVNPTNSEGLSHFHIACLYHEMEVVDKFLQHGSFDINQTIDFFVMDFPGCTPLHLALYYTTRLSNNDWTKLIQTVDLLLKYGANVTAKDVYGNTPLHQFAALRSPNFIILEKLMSYGADLKNENIKGTTPLALLSLKNPPDYAKVCEKYNCHANNNWYRLTGEGYIGKVLLSRDVHVANDSVFEKLMQSKHATIADEMDRTAIHNSVAVLNPTYKRVENVLFAIQSFVKRGIDVDHRDQSGRAALHYATRMQNRPGTAALLSCGADINILDNDGMSAFDYAMVHIKNKNDWLDRLYKPVAAILYLHVQKLQHLSVEVCQYNRNLAREFQQRLDDEHAEHVRAFNEREIKLLSQNFLEQIDLIKTINVGVGSLTVFDLLTETGVISLYPYLPKAERKLIDEFIEAFDYRRLDEVAGIIKLQFRKIATRLSLTDPAYFSLRALLGFSFPGLCEDVAMYLTNIDLKNLTASTNEK